MARRRRWQPPPPLTVTAKNYPYAIEVLECGLSTRVSHALVRNGYCTLAQVGKASVDDLLDARGIGVKALREIATLLRDRNLPQDQHLLDWVEGRIEWPWHRTVRDQVREQREREVRYAQRRAAAVKEATW